MELNLEKARELIDAAIEHAKRINVPITATVVNAGGHVIAKARMDGASFLSGQVADDKAYTSAAIHLATAELQPLVQPGAMAYGLNVDRIATFGGGFPLRVGGRMVGGIGVSGGSVDEDVEIAQAALRRWDAS